MFFKYEDNGYVVVKRLFNKEEIANLVEATEDFLQRYEIKLFNEMVLSI